MSFWKPLIDWNASQKAEGQDNPEAKKRTGVGIWKLAPILARFDRRRAEERMSSGSPGDIHGAF